MDLRELTAGWQRFKREEYGKNRAFLEGLAKGHLDKPIVVIGCVDPRVNLPWVTSQRAGLVSQHNTVGTIIPIWGSYSITQETYLEFAVNAFKAEHLIVLGHTDCRMVKALLGPKKAFSEIGPAFSTWASLSQDTETVVRQKLAYQAGEEIPRGAYEVHTLLQARNLMTYPVVRQAVLQGKLQLHALLYDIGTADLYEYSEREGIFELLSSRYAGNVPANADKHVCGSACLHHL